MGNIFLSQLLFFKAIAAEQFKKLCLLGVIVMKHLDLAILYIVTSKKGAIDA